jgi:hypothetical protein
MRILRTRRFKASLILPITACPGPPFQSSPFPRLSPFRSSFSLPFRYRSAGNRRPRGVLAATVIKVASSISAAAGAYELCKILVTNELLAAVLAGYECTL